MHAMCIYRQRKIHAIINDQRCIAFTSYLYCLGRIFEPISRGEVFLPQLDKTNPAFDKLADLLRISNDVHLTVSTDDAER